MAMLGLYMVEKLYRSYHTMEKTSQVQPSGTL